MTQLYLSGPMLGVAEHNFPAFHRAARVLRRADYVVRSPAEFAPSTTHRPPDRTEILRRDLVYLVACDGIALLPGWRGSRGATFELLVAAQIGLQIFEFVDDDDDDDDLDDVPEAISCGGLVILRPYACSLADAATLHASAERATTPPGDADYEALVRTSVCREADDAVNGPRQATYGAPARNFARIAALWEAYLAGKYGFAEGVTPDDVAALQILVKIARLEHGYHRDSVVDVAGYAACWERLDR